MDVLIFRPEDVADDQLRFAVIATRLQDRWVFCRHQARDTWEIPGGHRENGEAIDDTARRELYEETGIREAALRRIAAYGVKRGETLTCGMLYLAVAEQTGPLPAGTEIAEAQLFETLPDHLTYPAIQPTLYKEVQSWLNLRTAADELWDVYTADRKLTGRLHRRGDPMQEGDYHLGVLVWLLNERGEFIITRRSANKGYPLLWESTGGAAQAGDDSLQAAIREAREETGLILDPACGTLLYERRGVGSFTDVWLFRQPFRVEDVVLQPGETCDARYATADEIRRMYAEGTFVPYRDLEYNLQMIDQAVNGKQTT